MTTPPKQHAGYRRHDGKMTITYQAQPTVHALRGTIPLAGTRHIYTVTRMLWPEAVTDVIDTLLQPPSLHVCCGQSLLGDVRLDCDPQHHPHIVADAARLPCHDQAFASVLCDPPYNGQFQWNHDMLFELGRVAAKRIIFQHWFVPVTPEGCYKKWHTFHLTALYLWQPRTYFGRAQILSVFDKAQP